MAAKRVPKHLIDMQNNLLSEAAQYAGECDHEAGKALFQAWMAVLGERVPEQADSDAAAEASDRIVFTALAHLIGSWLAAKHCDACRGEWAGRVALLANRIGCVTADAVAPAPADATLH